MTGSTTPIRPLHGLWRRFVADSRGTVAVEALVLSLLLLAMIFVGYQLARLVSVRRTFHEAVYTATRYLAFNPIDTDNKTEWEDVAELFIKAEMDSNQWSPDNARLELSVDFTSRDCGEILIVDADLDYVAGPPRVPIRFREHREDVICGE